MAYVVYIPRTTQKDKGGLFFSFKTCHFIAFILLQTGPQHTAQMPSGAPLALKVGDGNNKYDLSYVFAHQRLGLTIIFMDIIVTCVLFRRQVLMMGLDTDIEDTTLFWEMKNKTPKPGECFYFPRVG
jgi:hypothetical protein